MAVKIYGAGGAGINIAAYFLNPKEESNIPDIKVVGLDASDSNIRDAGKYKEENLFLIPDTDGSGKNRKENYSSMVKHLPKVMMTHPPEDYNIVIYSDGGGSGSVFGPLAVKAIAEEGKPVISIVVGCGGNLTEAKNSMATIKTIEGIADSLNLTLAVSYIGRKEMSKQDASAVSTISCLLKLFSGKLDGMDSKDVTNWINHEIHTGLGSRMNILNIAVQKEDLADVRDVISVASVYKDRQTPHNDISTLYHTTGYGLDADNVDQLHFCLSETEADELLKSAEKEYTHFKQLGDSAVRNKPKIDSDDMGFSF